MDEITVIHIAIFAASVAAGVATGWVVRGSRCTREKTAVNEGWQQQLEAQRSEHDRLIEQNKNLMEQVSQVQASGRDATNRARELSAALKEAFERRDQLQRELKEVRSNLEVAIRQRDTLEADKRDTEARGDSAQAALTRKDDKIVRLSRELENWQSRLPPLLEKFRQRDEQAKQLAEALEIAHERIEALESRLDSDGTRAEHVDPGSLGDALDASNDPSSVTRTGISDVISDAADDAQEADPDVGAKHERAVLDQVDANDDTVDEPVTEAGDEDAEVDAQTAIAEHLAAGDELAEVGAQTAIAEHLAAGDGDARDSAVIASLPVREPGGVRDDLKLIKGVGPAIEKTLNELGIFRFNQIAEMTEYDIERVARRLKGLRSRIYREDWMGQARDLQLQKTAT